MTSLVGLYLIGTPTAIPSTTTSTSTTPATDQPGGTTPAPTPAASATATATSSPTASGSAATTRATWTAQSAWETGYVANLTVTSDLPRHGWTVRWADASATSVMNAWGMTCSVADGAVTCSGDGFGADLRPGQPVQAGLQVVTSGPAPSDPRLEIS